MSVDPLAYLNIQVLPIHSTQLVTRYPFPPFIISKGTSSAPKSYQGLGFYKSIAVPVSTTHTTASALLETGDTRMQQDPLLHSGANILSVLLNVDNREM